MVFLLNAGFRGGWHIYIYRERDRDRERESERERERKFRFRDLGAKVLKRIK